MQSLLDDRRALEKKLSDALRNVGGGEEATGAQPRTGAERVDGVALVGATVQAGDVRALQALGDALREHLPSGVAALGATFGMQNGAARGGFRRIAQSWLRADALIKDVARSRRSWWWKATHAQAGSPTPTRSARGCRVKQRRPSASRRQRVKTTTPSGAARCPDGRTARAHEGNGARRTKEDALLDAAIEALGEFVQRDPAQQRRSISSPSCPGDGRVCRRHGAGALGIARHAGADRLWLRLRQRVIEYPPLLRASTMGRSRSRARRRSSPASRWKACTPWFAPRTWMRREPRRHQWRTTLSSCPHCGRTPRPRVPCDCYRDGRSSWIAQDVT